jgi:hypothetical protein
MFLWLKWSRCGTAVAGKERLRFDEADRALEGHGVHKLGRALEWSDLQQIVRAPTGAFLDRSLPRFIHRPNQSEQPLTRLVGQQ